MAIKEFGKKFEKLLESNTSLAHQMSKDTWIRSVYEYMIHKQNGRRISEHSLKNTKTSASKEVFAILNNVIMESNAIS